MNEAEKPSNSEGKDFQNRCPRYEAFYISVSIFLSTNSRTFICKKFLSFFPREKPKRNVSGLNLLTDFINCTSFRNGSLASEKFTVSGSSQCLIFFYLLINCRSKKNHLSKIKSISYIQVRFI
jgi:hypothetical protein